MTSISTPRWRRAPTRNDHRPCRHRTPALLYRTGGLPSLDGNTVELGREQVAFAQNALAYSATLSFVQGKVSTITRALKGE